MNLYIQVSNHHPVAPLFCPMSNQEPMPASMVLRKGSNSVFFAISPLEIDPGQDLIVIPVNPSIERKALAEVWQKDAFLALLKRIIEPDCIGSELNSLVANVQETMSSLPTAKVATARNWISEKMCLDSIIYQGISAHARKLADMAEDEGVALDCHPELQLAYAAESEVYRLSVEGQHQKAIRLAEALFAYSPAEFTTVLNDVTARN